LATVAIVLDFVNPVLSLWRLIDQGRKLWLDESESGDIGSLTEEARTVDCQGFFRSKGERLMMAGKPPSTPNYHLVRGLINAG
jgi:hypothetical protein